MKKKAGSKNSLNPKLPFKWVFMDIIPSTEPRCLKSDTTFFSYLLIVDAYSKIQKLYGMEKIATEEVINNLDMFQSAFGKNRRIWMVRFGNNFSRCRYRIYLNQFQRRISNSQSSFDISGSKTSGNEQTG